MPEYVLSLSYGKDSMACLGAIEQLGWPLDRIVHVELWATDEIPADLPPMVEFKQKADRIIEERYGIKVEHVCAVSRERERERHTNQCSTMSCQEENTPEALRVSLLQEDRGVNTLSMGQKLTYEKLFYRVVRKPRCKMGGHIYGFPIRKGNWCSALKLQPVNQLQDSRISTAFIATESLNVRGSISTFQKALHNTAQI